METFSALLALYAGNSPVTGEFPAQSPMTQRFDAFFDLRLNEQLSKQSWGWWFEKPTRSLWRHCNDIQHYWPPHAYAHIRRELIHRSPLKQAFFSFWQSCRGWVVSEWVVKLTGLSWTSDMDAHVIHIIYNWNRCIKCRLDNTHFTVWNS